MDCEGKIVIFKVGTNDVYRQSLHWARRDPAIFNNLDQVFSPVNLNRNDEEPLDIFVLKYFLEDKELGPGACIESVSPRIIRLERNIKYNVGITVYTSNTVPKFFTFKLYWDGTLEGYNKAFSKA